MATETNQFKPDYAIPPGWILEEYLQTMGTSQTEFARRCGLSLDLVNGIITGEAPLEPAAALQFERVLGLDAGIWLGIESRYSRRGRSVIQ